MRNINGHIEGLYNLIADYSEDTRKLFSSFLGIKIEDISVKLRRTDISAQVIVDSEHIKNKCDTKIIFIVNRLNEYETHESINDIILSLSNLMKMKDRRKKLDKIKTKML
jgi:hypothetical protein